MLQKGEIPQLGVVLPIKETGYDGLMEILRLFGHGALQFLLLYDHVLLDEPSKPASVMPRLYTNETPFLEPLITTTALSQITEHCQLITGVLVAPQRQTALLAQQAAHASIFSNGRLELGLGVGWNPDEYRALGIDFHRRGERLNKQIELLKELWTRGDVTFTIGEEVIERMGINPKPNQPIPVWGGGWSARSIERAAKLTSGWMPMDEPGRFSVLKKELLRKIEEYQRDPNTFKAMGRVTLGTKSMSQCIDEFFRWIELGTTHVALSTTGQRQKDPFFHIQLLGEFLRATRDYRHSHKIFQPQLA